MVVPDERGHQVEEHPQEPDTSATSPKAARACPKNHRIIEDRVSDSRFRNAGRIDPCLEAIDGTEQTEHADEKRDRERRRSQGPSCTRTAKRVISRPTETSRAAARRQTIRAPERLIERGCNDEPRSVEMITAEAIAAETDTRRGAPSRRAAGSTCSIHPAYGSPEFRGCLVSTLRVLLQRPGDHAVEAARAVGRD